MARNSRPLPCGACDVWFLARRQAFIDGRIELSRLLGSIPAPLLAAMRREVAFIARHLQVRRGGGMGTGIGAKVCTRDVCTMRVHVHLRRVTY